MVMSTEKDIELLALNATFNENKLANAVFTLSDDINSRMLVFGDVERSSQFKQDGIYNKNCLRTVSNN